MIYSFTGNNAFLNNFYFSPIRINLDGEFFTFPTVEHAFQFLKNENFLEELGISFTEYCSMTPSKAKRLGRKVTLREDWEGVKVEIMQELVEEKFNSSLAKRLIRTDPHVLVEGNTWHDNFWGVCTCDKCKDKVGHNMLGKILMRVREDLIVCHNFSLVDG